MSSTLAARLDHSSIWLIGWGQNTAHGLFPKGSKADSGRDLARSLYDQTTTSYQGYRTHFKWTAGSRCVTGGS